LLNIRGVAGNLGNIFGSINKDTTLVAVSKSVPVEFLMEHGRELLELGVRHLGENRAQEFLVKYDALKEYGFVWHFLGHLQRNKVRQVVGRASLIHSLDSMRLAEEISQVATGLGSQQDVLIEVNIAREPNKYGLDPDCVLDFAAEAVKLPNIAVRGLMAMGRLGASASEKRAHFDEMAVLYKKLGEFAEVKYLSMGMSNDYEIAVERGANIVRIGRGIFGERV